MKGEGEGNEGMREEERTGKLREEGRGRGRRKWRGEMKGDGGVKGEEMKEERAGEEGRNVVRGRG